MMELPFEIIQAINEKPFFLVFYAAFHPFGFLLLFIVFPILKKLGVYTPKKEIGLFTFALVMIFCIGWILGFTSQILLLFIGVSGIKMLLIYLLMYLCIAVFVMFNVKSLKKTVNSIR